MSNVADTFFKRQGRRALHSPALQAGIITAALFLLSWHFQANGLYDFANTRKDQIYSSVFTFLSILLGASVSVWALLKSRATRYIERLHENMHFRAFVSQFERRLLLCFTVIIFAFYQYIAGSDFSYKPGHSAYLTFMWILSAVYSPVAIFDSLKTARHMLG